MKRDMSIWVLQSEILYLLSQEIADYEIAERLQISVTDVNLIANELLLREPVATLLGMMQQAEKRH